MKIAVEGCLHGELDAVYGALALLEQQQGIKVDALLVCGDFQSIRNQEDLEAMAVPAKYMQMGHFWEYYAGVKKAPVLTVFIGGNHEASNYLGELFYGGWVAENIYYVGAAGVVTVGDLRVGGLSGIYDRHHYRLGHFELPPYNNDSKRSVYHIRECDVIRLSQLATPMDVFMSHDWPQGIALYGNTQQLLRRKAFLQREINDNSLGSPPAAHLLRMLQPRYWFSAHLHVKFAALVQHPAPEAPATTRFLSLDKCLPHRDYLQIVDLPDRTAGPLSYDAEWLAILRKTHASLTLMQYRVPPIDVSDMSRFRPTPEEVEAVRQLVPSLEVPHNFAVTTPPYDPRSNNNARPPAFGQAHHNPQTAAFCALIGIPDPTAGPPAPQLPVAVAANPEVLDIDDDDAIGNNAAAAAAASIVPDKNPEMLDLGDDDDNTNGDQDAGQHLDGISNARLQPPHQTSEQIDIDD